jgi:hypothetical protein
MRSDELDLARRVQLLGVEVAVSEGRTGKIADVVVQANPLR